MVAVAAEEEEDGRAPLERRRPRNREVSSRYKSAIARRFPSPNLGRSGELLTDSAAADPSPKQQQQHQRAQSAERKRGEEWWKQQQQRWTMLRATAAAASVDHQAENSRPLDNLLPGNSSAQVKSANKSMDLSGDRQRRQLAVEAEMGGSQAAPPPLQPPPLRPNRSIKGTEVAARLWQDVRSGGGGAPMSRRMSDINQLRSSLQSDRRAPLKLGSQTPQAASTWSSFLLHQQQQQQQPAVSKPASPTSSCAGSRGVASPTRGSRAAGAVSSSSSSRLVACALNFGTDAASLGGGAAAAAAGGRGSVRKNSGGNDAHYLRILHNRWLQWRLVIARAQAAADAQRSAAERLLSNAGTQLSELRGRVATARADVRQAAQQQRLQSAVEAQAAPLEQWARSEQQHSSALCATIRALDAATINLPVSSTAKVDVSALQSCIASAGDALGSLEASLQELLPRASWMRDWACELGLVAAQEITVLRECWELLDRAANLKMEDRSLRSYLVQLGRV